MLRRNPVSRWFRRRMFGFGYSPGSWEGWAVTLVGSLMVGRGLAYVLQRTI